MRKTVKLQIEMSEKREKINAFLGKEELTDDERAELDVLTKRAQEIEIELRAALVADGEAEDRARAAFDGTPATPATPEARELERITAAASVVDIVAATVAHRATEGATAELQKHLGIGGDQVPLELLEVRAADPYPGAHDTGEPNQSAVRPGCVPRIDRCVPRHRTAERGRRPGSSYHVLSTNLTASVPAMPVADGANTAGAFTSAVLEPKRVQGAFVLRREDKARLGPQLEGGFAREPWGWSSSNEAGPGITDRRRRVHGCGQPGHRRRRPQSGRGRDLRRFCEVASADQVDGLYADTVAGVRILLGPIRLQARLWASYRAGTAASARLSGDESALERIQALSGGVRATSHIPAVAAKIGTGPRGARDRVSPIWFSRSGRVRR